MLFPQTRLVLGLALALLWPATAFAQVPSTPAQADAQQVQLKVDFVIVSAADLNKSLDELGVVFDRVPLAQPTDNPGPTRPFLRYLAGNFAAQLFQTVLHAGGKVVQAPLITTTTNVPASIQVNYPAMQSGLTITPRINTDDSITMNLAPQNADTNGLSAVSGIPHAVTTLRTVRSGDTMALVGLPFRSAKPVNGQELLIFVTSTLLGPDAPKTDVGQPFLSLPGNTICHVFHEREFSLDVAAGDLRAVVAMLERQVGLKASVQGGAHSYTPVSVHLNGASQSDVLAAIARGAGAQIIRDENGVYVFSPLPGAARTPQPLAAPGHGGRSVTVTP